MESCPLAGELGFCPCLLPGPVPGHTHSPSCLLRWWSCLSIDWGSREAGGDPQRQECPWESHRKSQPCLPSVSPAQISGRLGCGRHSEGATLWLEWAQHLGSHAGLARASSCLPALCAVAVLPGLVRCRFCRVTLVYKAPRGLEPQRYYKAVAWGCQAAHVQTLAPPLLCDTGQGLNLPELSFHVCRLGT